jgi:hypothetical protein
MYPTISDYAVCHIRTYHQFGKTALPDDVLFYSHVNIIALFEDAVKYGTYSRDKKGYQKLSRIEALAEKDRTWIRYETNAICGESWLGTYGHKILVMIRNCECQTMFAEQCHKNFCNVCNSV